MRLKHSVIAMVQCSKKFELVVVLCALLFAQTDAAFAQNDSRSLGTKGNALLQQQRFADAEVTYTEALKRARAEHNEKAIAGCLYNLSLVCAHQAEYNKAQKLLNELESMKSRSSFVTDVQLKKQQSNIFYGQAKYVESEAIDRSMLAATRDTRTSLEVRLHQSLNQFCQNKNAECEASLDMVIATAKKLSPQSIDILEAAYKQRGKLHTWTSQFQKAQLDYESEVELLRSKPDMKAMLASALNDLGGVLRARKSYEKALKTFEEAYDASSKSEQDLLFYYGNCGCVYLDLRENEKAEAAFNQALKLTLEHPSGADLAQCTSNLASVYARQGRTELARRKFDEAIALAEKASDKSGLVMIRKAKSIYLP
jgi:tetratricopeptide (TPR) repeat protein